MRWKNEKNYKKAIVLMLAVAMLGGSQTITWASDNFSSASENALFSDGTQFIFEDNVEIAEDRDGDIGIQNRFTENLGEIDAASSKEYDLSCSPNTLEFNKKFFDENDGSEYEILVTNTGTKDTSVYVHDYMLKNFRVKTDNLGLEEEDPPKLKPGESRHFFVEPMHFYGTYDMEVFYFKTDDGSEFPIQVSMNYEKPKPPLQLTPYQVKFGDIYVKSKEEQEPIKVTIRNASDEKMEVGLELDPAEYFRVGKLSRNILEPGETSEFNVWPDNGLPVGEYRAAIRIRMKFDSGKEEDFLQDVMVNVGDRLFTGVLPFESIKNIPNGTEKEEKALRLPESLTVYGEDKNTTFQVPVIWFLDECSYDPQIKEAQTFYVPGKLVLEPGENGNHLDTSVLMEVQVKEYQAIGIPVIKKTAAVTNYVSATLAGKAEEAEGYQFVVVKSSDDLEKEEFLSVKETDKLSANVKYIPQGKHILYCRGYRNKKDSVEYGAWSEGKEINVKYDTPQEPAIESYIWNNCDIRLNISIPEKVDGFDVVLANTYEETEPVDYALVKTSYPGTSKEIVISGIPKGRYYVGIHSYKKTAGVKVLSRWSNLISVVIDKGLVKTAPVIKKTTISRRNLTLQSAVPKGANGYDWVLAKKCVKNKNGTYKPSSYVSIQKNKKVGKIVFKNIKPGTYYLTGHAYVKGYQKSFGNWAKPKKIVIK
ncbi:hypothetical protein NXH76_04990 [Blautia schinkii]|nr:hypothetical protein [Blautia schinkii]